MYNFGVGEGDVYILAKKKKRSTQTEVISVFFDSVLLH